MKENIALTVALSMFVTVLTIFGLGRLDLMDALTGKADQDRQALRVAIVDLVKLSNEAARLSPRFSSGESALMRYESTIEKVSDQLRAQGFLVLPRSIILGIPSNTGVVEDMTPVYIEALKANS